MNRMMYGAPESIISYNPANPVHPVQTSGFYAECGVSIDYGSPVQRLFPQIVTTQELLEAIVIEVHSATALDHRITLRLNRARSLETV